MCENVPFTEHTADMLELIAAQLRNAKLTINANFIRYTLKKTIKLDAIADISLYDILLKYTLHNIIIFFIHFCVRALAHKFVVFCKKKLHFDVYLCLHRDCVALFTIPLE